MKIPRPGETFADRFEIIACIGGGGFGEVFRAFDTLIGRDVAIKIVRPTAGSYSAKMVQRFEREARLAREVEHPNVVRLLLRGITRDELRYLVFEYVEGHTIEELLRESGTADELLTTRVVTQMLEALGAAHARGAVHRDVKPANIMLTSDGTPKLLDFGVARIDIDGRPSQQALTTTGVAVGTPDFMAPEQLFREASDLRCDLYALGLVAIEMLWGEKVRRSWRADTIRAALGSAPSMQLPATVAPRLRHTLIHLTAAEPRDRPATAAAALKLLSDRLPTTDRPEPVDARPDRRAAIGLVGSAVVFGSLALWAASNEEPDRRNLPSVARTAPIPRVAPSVATITPDLGPDAPAPAPALVSPLGESNCGSAAPFTGVGVLSTVEGLREISWGAYVPAAYEPDKPTALVVLLHEEVARSSVFLRKSGFMKVADEHGFLIIAPQTQEGWREDAGVVRTFVQFTMDKLCVDTARIFIVGQAQGGWLAEHLTCEEWVAAAAVHANRRTKGGEAHSCDPATPRPMLHAMPKHSRHEPFDGSEPCKGRPQYSALEVEKHWTERNLCGARRALRFEHGDSKCWSWNCEEAFVSCHLDGGHQWPGLAERRSDLRGCDGPPTDFPLAEQIWQFFDDAVPSRDPAGSPLQAR